ncbi:nucleolar DEAD-box protein required for synthesis of 60S ribosomal subunit [Balamuthia mandrillaris]
MTGRGLSVISDIDDTIKVSHVADKKLLMQNTFMRPFEAVPGMARLYQRWRRIDLQGAEGGRAEEGEGEVRNGARYDEKAELEYKEAAEKKKEKDEDEELMKNGEKEAKQTTTRFHYVSGSPWQLCGLLKSFLEEKGFPKGSMHLRHFRIKDSSAVQAAWTPPYTFKQRAIEPLLQMFPERKFIFVGDSGEMDPEVYGDLARAYPNQVLAIFIRRAPENPKMVLKQREALQKEKEEEEARKNALAPKEKALIAENEQVKEAILTTIEETQEEQGRMADEKNNEAEKEMKEDEKKAEEIAKEMQEIEKGEEEAAKDTEQLQENAEEVKEIEQVTEEGSVEDKLNEESQAEEKTEDERNEKEGEVDDRAEREARRWQVTFRDLDKTLWQVFDNAEELFSVRLPDLFH